MIDRTDDALDMEAIEFAPEPKPKEVGLLSDLPFCESTPVPPPPPPGGRANMGRKRKRNRTVSTVSAEGEEAK